MRHEYQAEKQVAKRIKALRVKAGFTQEQLAEKTGIGYKYIQAMEGKTPKSITVRSLEKLAKALDVDLIEFFRF